MFALIIKEHIIKNAKNESFNYFIKYMEITVIYHFDEVCLCVIKNKQKENKNKQTH